MAKSKKKFSKFVNNKFDFTLCITVFILLGLGIIMLLSASSPSALAETGNSYEYLQRQAGFAIAGIIVMFFISKIDYRFYKKFYGIAYLISVGLLILVLLVGDSSGGAKRWLDIGFSFQPSEMVKVLLIIFYAGVLSKNRENLGKFGKGFLFNLMFLVPIIALLLLQPHYSATVVIVAICCVVMLIAGTKLKHFFLISIPAIIGAIILIVTEPYRLKRLVVFLDPWADIQNDGWQVVQSLYAIGSGGLFGAGLGESKQKYLYLPEPHNDFIFSVIAEELGFMGCLLIIVLFAIFIWRGILIAMRAPDMFGSLVAVGITSLVGIQVIINIAVVTSSMPATGMPLPFFSSGGTALLVLLASIGILLNISRAGSK